MPSMRYYESLGLWTKRCSKCGCAYSARHEALLAHYFATSGTTSDKLQSQCRDCQKGYIPFYKRKQG